MLLHGSLAVVLGLMSATLTVAQDTKPAAATTTTTTTAKADASPAPEPCTVRSPHSGNFFDLKSLNIPDPASLTDKARARARDYSWNATGWDMGYNFTMNFCGPVVEDLQALGGVVGVDKEVAKNVSAYYRKDDKVFSIGQLNLAPVIRGRKLVLNYTDGSPCEPTGSSTGSTVRRKSTIISMLCEKDPLLPQLTLSFVAASQDECTYFFEARSAAACAGIEQAKQTLSPAGVFGLMLLITGLVYLVGGCVYSRVVLQQRGWRQLPNYGLWAAICGFAKDLLIVLTSGCLRLLPRGPGGLRGGTARYTSPSRSGNARFLAGGGFAGHSHDGGAARGRDSEAENRLIDELNEEWDD